MSDETDPRGASLRRALAEAQDVHDVFRKGIVAGLGSLAFCFALCVLSAFTGGGGLSWVLGIFGWLGAAISVVCTIVWFVMSVADEHPTIVLKEARRDFDEHLEERRAEADAAAAKLFREYGKDACG